MTSNGPGKTSARSLRASALRRMTPAPSARQLRAAVSSAVSEMSAAYTCAPGSASARVAAMQPLPVPTSRRAAAVVSACDPYRQLLGFGPGNQHPFAHGERAAAELRVPHDILHRTACGQLAEDVVQLRDFERRAGIGQQGRRAQPRQLRDGDEGDAPCFTRPVEGREACRNTAEYVAARGH